MADDLASRALWLEVAERLRQRILSGELSPGARLNEVELATMFGVSRGPVREAIRQLAGEGLVVELPRRGAVVSMLDDRDLVEVYTVREALETSALPAIISTVDESQIAALERTLDAFETPGRSYIERAADDLAFHRALVGLSGNRRLIGIYGEMLMQTTLLLRAAAETRANLRTEMPTGVHRDIISAVRARDRERARSALERHYAHALARLQD